MLMFVLASLGYLLVVWIDPTSLVRLIFLVILCWNWVSVCEALGIGRSFSIKGLLLLMVYWITLLIVGNLLHARFPLS